MWNGFTKTLIKSWNAIIVIITENMMYVFIYMWSYILINV